MQRRGSVCASRSAALSSILSTPEIYRQALLVQGSVSKDLTWCQQSFSSRNLC